jgi:hypothetical protein
MSKLSRAAQAVLDAYRDAGIDDEVTAAAVLRAARDELAPDKTIKDIDYLPQSYVDGYADALDEILAIAIELEAP